MNNSSVRYGYAFVDGTRHVVKICDLDRDGACGHSFQCPFCHSDMYPTFGNVQQHHFRHRGEKCDHDSYLHSVAEEAFREEFAKCASDGAPFCVEFTAPVACGRDCLLKSSCRHTDTFIVDLTKDYGRVTLERSVRVDDHRRRPDILLASDCGRELWIEIWVTHRTTDEKMKDSSILEIKIEREEDIEDIRRHHVTVVRTSDISTSFSNSALVVTPFDTQGCRDFCGRLDTGRKKRAQSGAQEGADAGTDQPFDESKVEWVDLGLPSGVLWARRNKMKMISFDKARDIYRSCLPSQELAEELHEKCKKEWDSASNSLILTGPSGNSISFECPDRYAVHFWIDGYSDRIGMRHVVDKRYAKVMRLFPGKDHLFPRPQSKSSMSRSCSPSLTKFNSVKSIILQNCSYKHWVYSISS